MTISACVVDRDVIERRHEKGGVEAAAVPAAGRRSAKASKIDESWGASSARLQACAGAAALGGGLAEHRGAGSGWIVACQSAEGARTIPTRGAGGGVAGSPPAWAEEAADVAARSASCCNGLRPTSQGLRSVVGPPDREGDRAPANRQAGWPRSHSRDTRRARLEALAEKKCGAFRRSTKSS